LSAFWDNSTFVMEQLSIGQAGNSWLPKGVGMQRARIHFTWCQIQFHLIVNRWKLK
jgi:hypothetical protein